MFSDHHEVKLEITNEKFGKFANMWKLNSTLQNNQQVKRKKHKGNFIGNHTKSTLR